MTTLNDVKAFLLDNKENEEVQNYVKGLVSDDRMLEHALETDKGKSFFNKQFDKKISEAKKKMEENYSEKLESTLTAKEQEWIDKHKEKPTKSPVELKLEEMERKHAELQNELKRKDIMGVVNQSIPEPLRPYAEKHIDSKWTTEDAKAFTEQFNAALNNWHETENEKKLNNNRNNIGNPPKNNKGGSRYANLDANQLAALPEEEYKIAISELAEADKKNND